MIPEEEFDDYYAFWAIRQLPYFWEPVGYYDDAVPWEEFNEADLIWEWRN